MGYCMTQRYTSFGVKKENQAAMLAAIHSLAGQESIIDSGGRHFAWIDKNFHKIEDLAEFMNEWRWELRFNSDGDIYGIDFTGEKYGDEDILFGAIAPFVEPGSVITMVGEDGEHWRWRFTGNDVKKEVATLNWGA